MAVKKGEQDMSFRSLAEELRKRSEKDIQNDGQDAPTDGRELPERIRLQLLEDIYGEWDEEEDE